jgi:hypothetical protein
MRGPWRVLRLCRPPSTYDPTLDYADAALRRSQPAAFVPGAVSPGPFFACADANSATATGSQKKSSGKKAAAADDEVALEAARVPVPESLRRVTRTALTAWDSDMKAAFVSAASAAGEKSRGR